MQLGDKVASNFVGIGECTPSAASTMGELASLGGLASYMRYDLSRGGAGMLLVHLVFDAG